VDREDRKLIEFVEEKGWEIFNGNMRGDEEGEYTFTGGKGNTVIDYIMGSKDVKEELKESGRKSGVRPSTGGDQREGKVEERRRKGKKRLEGTLGQRGL